MAVTFNGEDGLQTLTENFTEAFINFKSFLHSFNAAQVNKSSFDTYTAKAVTKQLVDLLNKIIPIN